ncbi:MAG TPA: hypothetical protein VKW08_06435 [Xanthobacteraceae bacterium]|jgi:transposase-like protein|nr:hypothetical protein [Xanthobacteraceae bacterium]
MADVTRFECPQCKAGYKVVRVEAPPASVEQDIVCVRCGAPLQARDGNFVLKYFLMEGPGRRKRTPR